jgi:hypothetical protein
VTGWPEALDIEHLTLSIEHRTLESDEHLKGQKEEAIRMKELIWGRKRIC